MAHVVETYLEQLNAARKERANRFENFQPLGGIGRRIYLLLRGDVFHNLFCSQVSGYGHLLAVVNRMFTRPPNQFSIFAASSAKIGQIGIG